MSAQTPLPPYGQRPPGSPDSLDTSADIVGKSALLILQVVLGFRGAIADYGVILFALPHAASASAAGWTAFQSGNSINCRGVAIAIPRNGCKTSRSLSPLTTQVALPLTASSRNLSSLGSRHATTRSTISTKMPSLTKALRNSIRSSSVMYLSNPLRRRTSSNSATVTCEISNLPVCVALSKA